MSPSVTALLAAALVAVEPAAVEPPATGEAYAYVIPVPPDMMFGAGPMEQLEATMFGVLPQAPTIVLRQTHYYGTITIDHRAHVARRISCKLCHGPKPVQKITFTPRVAHERCVGCHQTVAKGPTKCQGCHVKSATPPAILIAAAAPAAAEPPPKPPEPNPGNVSAALAAFENPPAGAGSDLFAREDLHRWLETGLAAGTGQGGSIRLVFQQDHVLLTHGIERMSSASTARTFGLFGAGLSRPIRALVSFQAVGLVGFDVVDRPIVAVFPSIGARAGVEVRPRHRLIQQFTASVTGVVDPWHRAYGRDVGAITIYGTIGTGFSLL